jgi:hypothetical protein
MSVEAPADHRIRVFELSVDLALLTTAQSHRGHSSFVAWFLRAARACSYSRYWVIKGARRTENVATIEPLLELPGAATARDHHRLAGPRTSRFVVQRKCDHKISAPSPDFHFCFLLFSFASDRDFFSKQFLSPLRPLEPLELSSLCSFRQKVVSLEQIVLAAREIC